ncbi:hypothetical protein [Paraliomyxa miuraensis]|uniref:hypothetical protein n=1 Tax=Paraliomyxa miuraensis TaxID=376150 RepID=UPI00225B4A31|nr:hypothetical protein [Paraliomyxa miuraensis]MCX4241805.1 hypothetical protein [Paraliomyxa miuraensis]
MPKPISSAMSTGNGVGAALASNEKVDRMCSLRPRLQKNSSPRVAAEGVVSISRSWIGTFPARKRAINLARPIQ